MRRPDPHGAVPATRTEAILGHEVPIHAEHFSVMFFIVLDGEVVECAVEELDTAVARRREDLVLVDFGPGEIVEGILGCEP